MAGGYGSLTAYIAVHDAAAAIEFYKSAFGAKERYRIDMDGRIGHAEVEIGGGVLYLSDEFADHDAISPKTLGGTGCAFVLEMDDLDAGWQRAVDAGATVTRPISEAPFGRGGWLKDPFGFRWNLMTPNPNFNPADMDSRLRRSIDARRAVLLHVPDAGACARQGVLR